MRQHNSKLKSQIVESPEKLREMIKNMKTSLKGEREVIDEANKKTQELQMKIDMLNRYEKEVVRAIKLIEEVGNEMKKVKDQSRDIKNSRNLIDNLEKENRELNTEEQVFLFVFF